MTSSLAISRWLTHSPLIAVVLYIAVTGGLLATAGLAVSDIVDRQGALAQKSGPAGPVAGENGAKRVHVSAGGRASRHAVSGGTDRDGCRSAALLQRVAAAVSAMSAAPSSRRRSTYQASRPKHGLVGLVVSCEDGTARAAESAL